MRISSLIGIGKNYLQKITLTSNGFTTWTIQIAKKDQTESKSDSWIGSVITAVTQTVRMVQSAVSSIFPSFDPNYDDLCDFESFISLNGSHSSEIVKNVIENGSFRSVNKIREPNIMVVELAKGGWSSEVEATLDRLRTCAGTTKLCRIITPYGIIENLNMIKLEYRFSSEEGSGLLNAKITFQEVISGRVGPARWITQVVRSPSSTNTVEGGKRGLQ